MAGHSKWKQIKHKKAVTDAKRGAMFTKLIREITVAARAGGGDPAGNPRLRTAIETARGQNMPNDNIQRAIKKGTGELEGVTYQEITYEGYGPGGVAILVETTTDNPNRTVADVRHVFSRHDGNIGSPNSVAWMFERCGQIAVEATGLEEDTVLEAALEAGATDFTREDDQFIVTSAVGDLHSVASALRDRGYQTGSVEIAHIPKNTVQVSDQEAEKLLKLLDALDDLDDVARVHGNFEMDANQMLKVGG